MNLLFVKKAIGNKNNNNSDRQPLHGYPDRPLFLHFVLFLTSYAGIKGIKKDTYHRHADWRVRWFYRKKIEVEFNLMR